MSEATREMLELQIRRREVALDVADKRIRELEAQVDASKHESRYQCDRAAAAEKRIAELEARVLELEQSLEAERVEGLEWRD